MSGRIRSVKPEWLEDEALLRCSSDARVVSVALMLLADDYGNGRGSDLYLGAQIFPGEPLAKIREALAELSRARFAGLYEMDGQTYFAIRSWEKHQRVDKPGKPRVPAPLEGFRETLAKITGAVVGSSRLTPIRSDQDHDHDRDHDQSPRRKKKTPPAPTALQSEFGQAVNAWFQGYRQVYGKAPVWGPVQGKQLKAIMAKVNDAAELLTLIPLFFRWQRPEVIKAGHSLSTGYASFAMKLDELRADVLNAKRREGAAVAADAEKNANRKAATVGQAERVAAKFMGAQHGTNNTPGKEAQLGGSGRSLEAPRVDGGDDQPHDLG